MGSSCCCAKQNDHGPNSRTPLLQSQPSVDEAKDRFEQQKKTIEEEIEKLRQQLQETRYIGVCLRYCVVIITILPACSKGGGGTSKVDEKRKERKRKAKEEGKGGETV